MFSPARRTALREVVWSTEPNEAEYIEAWKFSNDSPLTRSDVRYGRLNDSEIEDWLQQKGSHSPPKPSQGAILEGGIRLIISERVFYNPPSLSISRDSYLRIEEEFHLPPVSLLTLSNEDGVCYRHEVYDEKKPHKLKRIDIVVKARQKYQVGNSCLTMSYDFATGLTTGLLIGTGVTQGGIDLHLWPHCPSAEIYDLIKAVPSLLAQPMLLPTILLQHHLSRAQDFCHVHLGNSQRAIQAQLGMNRAGRMRKDGPFEDPVGEKTIKETRVNLRNLTGEMSTFLTEISWCCTVSDWQCDCVEFFKRTLDDIAAKGSMSDRDRAKSLSEEREIKECIEYLGSSARGLRRLNNNFKELANADIGVLYSILAQLDNRLNAKMSASSSRDSTAMKALAFITTLFLPGTFVATVFSMSMFDWQTSATSSSQTVSSIFWIYWVITVPLTLVVAYSWRLWWKWEKRSFDRDVRIEIENIEETKWGETSNNLLRKGDHIATLVQDLRKGWQGLHRRNIEQNVIRA